MADESTATQHPIPHEIKIVKREGAVCDIYANYVHLAWTATDVAIRFYKVVQPIRELQPGVPNELEQQGTATLAWGQAKLLRNVLNDIVGAYEKANGEIKEFVPLA